MRIFTADVPELERYISLEDAKLRQELVSLRWRKTDVKALHFLEKRYNLMLTSLRNKNHLNDTPYCSHVPRAFTKYLQCGDWVGRGPENKPTGVNFLAVNFLAVNFLAVIPF